MAKVEGPRPRSSDELADVWPDPPVDEAGSPHRSLPKTRSIAASWRICRDLTPEPITLPPREPDDGYVRPPMSDQTFVPEVY